MVPVLNYEGGLHSWWCLCWIMKVVFIIDGACVLKYEGGLHSWWCVCWIMKAVSIIDGACAKMWSWSSQITVRVLNYEGGSIVDGACAKMWSWSSHIMVRVLRCEAGLDRWLSVCFDMRPVFTFDGTRPYYSLPDCHLYQILYFVRLT